MARRIGQTALAKIAIDELRKLLTEPVNKKENEISFGEFLSAYDPKNEKHNFTYPIPDTRGLLNLRIYNVMMRPYVVLKLEHRLLYYTGLNLEINFEPITESKSILCANEFLMEEILKLEMELQENSEYIWLHEPRVDGMKKGFKEKEVFRKEYFPPALLEEIEKRKSLRNK